MTIVDKMSRKIPGFLPPPPRAEIDGRVKNLDKLSSSELLELRERQRKLLSNKTFISKLPDKGEKIFAFCQKIDEKLNCTQEEEATREMLEKLNLNGLDQETVQDVEWKGKMDLNSNTYLDSDDDTDPEDVLQVLSQRSEHERKVKILRDEKLLITSEDLKEIGPENLQHVKYIVSKTENKKSTKLSGQFKPYKTTKTDVHDPGKEGLRKKHKHWEVTAATPPPSQHGPAKIISIEESLQLQIVHNKHLREVETRHAAEKLMSKVGYAIGDAPLSTVTSGKYRDVDSDNSEYSDGERSDNEVHDEEPERGGVVFTVMN